MGSMSLRAKPACCFFGRLFLFCLLFSLSGNKRAKNFSPVLLPLPRFFSPDLPLFRVSTALHQPPCVSNFVENKKRLFVRPFSFLLYISRLNHTKTKALRRAQGFRRIVFSSVCRIIDKAARLDDGHLLRIKRARGKGNVLTGAVRPHQNAANRRVGAELFPHGRQNNIIVDAKGHLRTVI